MMRALLLTLTLFLFAGVAHAQNDRVVVGPGVVAHGDVGAEVEREEERKLWNPRLGRKAGPGSSAVP